MNPDASSQERVEAIDQFRGFALFIMVLGNAFVVSGRAPWWLEHPPDVGFRIPDAFAPFFVMAIGLTFGPSLRRRAAQSGALNAAFHALTRWAGLLLIGLIITLVEALLGANPSGVLWGVLEALGAGGLITLPFLFLPRWPRLAAGLGLLALYQALLDAFWLEDVLGAPHGGPWGALGWGGMMVLSTVLGDLFREGERGRKLYPWASGAILASGLLLALAVPVSKNRVSMSYVLIVVGLSGLAFFAMWLVTARWGRPSEFLSAWGQNPLLLYVLHIGCLGLYLIPAFERWNRESPLWAVCIIPIALSAFLSVIAAALYRRGRVLKL